MTEVAVALRANYFFLSYAHSPPLAGVPASAHDPWVKTLFSDLSNCVNVKASRRLDLAPGFIDQEIPLGADWRGSLLKALSSAEVFVPLYSPGYFAGSWPGREWACYELRLTNAGVRDPQQRFMPVLWSPLRPGEAPPGLRKALDVGDGELGYAENGLRAMLRLAPYRDAYHRIVERLAGQIVDLAERKAIRPSAVPDIDEVRSPFTAAPSAVFTVAVAAPAGSGLRAGVKRGSQSQPDYRPDPSLPEYVATIAEQLDFAVTVADLDVAAGELGSAPGIILIDPRFAANRDGLNALRRAVSGRPWVLPVVVTPAAVGQRVTDDEQAAEADLAHGIADALTESPPRSDTAREALAGVSSLERFTMLMPYLIAEAERQFLRSGPVKRTTAPPGSRPRLRGARLDPPGEWQDPGNPKGGDR